MQLQIDHASLPVYEALASEVRIHIIQLLSKKKMNIKELSEALSLSSPIVTKHVKKLEEAGLIRTEKVPGKSGQQRISILKVDHIEVNFPKKIYHSFATHETSIPVGHYSDYQIMPTCGLATEHDFVGPVDQTKYFMAPERMNAQILWFTQGFIEYKTPNFLQEDEQLQQLDISMEISSEFPFSNEVWPSDITFTLDGIELGKWESPGDFADTRGKFTPDWWPDNINQYGLLKTIRITSHGTYMDGEPMSDVTIDDLDTTKDGWTLRIEVKEDAEHVGGVTLFGRHFGNHDQDISFKLYYI
ncbi:ArsR family transcriptional regulator [Gracilibacillus halophilus YIM-C55.5]|uniref:ArsR family transcriptional regulator n=1 Tax=Gracilibacillus halophilus YIM-C55.5 TaxID=1308866 RepID=N4WQY7_9BACI|nr:ArsR family transcriptional regulator [Gracilibacillus halophilus]ENH96860.1 ArsR family transcriptional regulator [Gracilibacillus halophilus YIM-C55.5]